MSSRSRIGLLLVAVGVFAGCGPAPGYGYDGQRWVGPGDSRGYSQQAQQAPQGYVAPRQAPVAPPPAYAPSPTYQPYGQPAAAITPAPMQPPAAPNQGVFMAPPYPYQTGAAPIAPSASAQPIAPDPGPPPAAASACSDTCRFAHNGECDDGRDGSDTDVCGAGTDCGDCGPG